MTDLKPLALPSLRDITLPKEDKALATTLIVGAVAAVAIIAIKTLHGD